MECKVDMAISVTYLSRTPIFEWYVFRCGSKNVYKINRIFLVLKKHLFKKIGLHAQNIIIILGTVVNHIGGTYMVT